MSTENSKFKVVIFGCQQIAVDFINFLHKIENVEIPLIVTYELPLDKTYGYESVMEEGKKMGLNVKNPNRVTDKIIAEVESIKPDIIFSVYYRKIFPNRLLSIPRLGSINIHPSLLPEYRGPVPTAWTIQNGEKFFGLTIHKMDQGIDTGEIYVQQKFAIDEDETGYELYTRGMTLGAKMLAENFSKLINNEIVPTKQEGIGSYYGKKRGRYIINWQQRAEDIRNMIRVHAKPYNPAETLLLNRYLIINKAKALYDDKYIPQGPGKIVDVLDGDRLVVSCSDGCLILEDYEIFPVLNEIDRPLYLKKGNTFG